MGNSTSTVHHQRETFTDEFQYSDNSDVIESFEIVLLVMEARGLARVSRRDRADGSEVVTILLFADEEK